MRAERGTIDDVAASVALPHDLRASRQARELVQRALERWGLESLRNDAELCVSEMVTNAFLHAGTSCVCVVRRAGDDVLLEVTDPEPATAGVVLERRSEHRRAGPDAEEELAVVGRGLAIVEAVAADWGVEHDASTKTVWARLAHPTTPTADTLVTVRLLSVPVGLALANGSFCEELLREAQLSLYGPRAVPPPELARRFVDAMHSTAPTRLAGRVEALAAREAGLTHYTVRVSVGPESLALLRALNTVLEEMNRYCAEGLLLLPAAQDDLRRFRSWIEEEIGRQLAGAEPTACPVSAPGWTGAPGSPPL